MYGEYTTIIVNLLYKFIQRACRPNPTLVMASSASVAVESLLNVVELVEVVG